MNVPSVTPRQAITKAVNHIQSCIGIVPSVGLVLGSGLMSLATLIQQQTNIPYTSVPHFPPARVTGHDGTLHVGLLEGMPVACLAGRAHGYEGHPPERVVFGVRLLARLGCKVVILTNAAGSVVSSLRPGSLMLIADHLNLTGNNPLTGWYESSPRFVDMSNAYDSDAP